MIHTPVLTCYIMISALNEIWSLPQTPFRGRPGSTSSDRGGWEKPVIVVRLLCGSRINM